MRKRTLWILPVVAGLGMVVMAVLLSSSSFGSPGVKGASAVTACNLSITKAVADTTVAAGDNADYTITVKNDGGTDCAGFTVTDSIPAHMTCDNADVSNNSDITVITVGACKSSTTKVTWTSAKPVTKNDGNEAILTLSLTTDDTLTDGKTITNEACVAEGDTTPTDNCADRKITIGETATATPTPKATNTPIPVILPTSTPYVPPPAPTATARPLGTVAPPRTGTGSDGHASWPLALGLGLGGLCLLVVSGAALARKRIR